VLVTCVPAAWNVRPLLPLAEVLLAQGFAAALRHGLTGT